MVVFRLPLTPIKMGAGMTFECQLVCSLKAALKKLFFTLKNIKIIVKCYFM
jgi:hypothetical protein